MKIEKLKEYLQHKITCGVYPVGSGGQCTCGLNSLLAEAEKPLTADEITKQVCGVLFEEPAVKENSTEAAELLHLWDNNKDSFLCGIATGKRNDNRYKVTCVECLHKELEKYFNQLIAYRDTSDEQAKENAKMINEIEELCGIIETEKAENAKLKADFKLFKAVYRPDDLPENNGG